MPAMGPRRWLVLASIVLISAACGGGGGKNEAVTPPSSQPAPLQILVTNDDGYAAPGIDAVVEALRKEPRVRVDVVAPATNQSGQGDATTPGELAVADVRTASGFPAKSVAGRPADTVNVALDRLNLTPDLVVSGANAGQNIGEFATVSGTIGAAKVAARRGIPALAVSTGQAPRPDYAQSAALVIKWLRARRAALAVRRGAATVDSMNVPTCTAGRIRGVVRTKLAASFRGRKAAGPSNCRSTRPRSELADDVDLFLNGYATVTPVPI